MAYLDDLVSQVPDLALRGRLQEAVTDLRKNRKFGLVFEEHVPETTAVFGLPVQVGALVQRRQDTQGSGLFRIASLLDDGNSALLVSQDDGHQETSHVADLLTVKRFGEPMYAALKPLDRLRRGPDRRPYHAVINAENFHALQLFTYLYRGGADCIYIDPPYNTGATDWKYNNRFVDANDAWRHSKWLAMMNRRLRLARRLLKPDGVLIVTIDANEVHHLGLLLEQLFPDAQRQVVAICMNPSGASGEGLSRVDEYAFFCFRGGAQPNRVADDMLNKENKQFEWESLLRRGNRWYRRERKNLCYPVLIDPTQQRIVGVGVPLADDVDDVSRPQQLDGYPLAWPVRTDGRLGIWRLEGASLMNLAKQGFAYVSSRDDARGTWTIKYLLAGTVRAISARTIEVIGHGPRGQAFLNATESRKSIPKTIWHRGRHTAGGAGGTQMLTTLLGERGTFPYPKSVYAVRDCLETAVGSRRNALIIDFFAGSGTTLHATCLLNSEDGAQRRCVLVTNNEVEAAESRVLNERGLFIGDEGYEKRGIFENVTRPRCEAMITGLRPDGHPAEGEYVGGHAISEGFNENLEFYALQYLDPDAVELGEQFQCIHPLLWLAAGGIGEREEAPPIADYYVAPASPYGVLFKPSRLSRFLQALQERPDVTHVWIVTDSEQGYAEACEALPGNVTFTSQLYRDYLRTFRVNGRRS